MKKLASLAVGVLGVAGLAAAAPPSNPMADLEDVYAWMAGFTLNVAMTVSPLDDGSHSFDPSVQYVFHLSSKTGLGLQPTSTTTSETRLIARFASNTQVQVWVTDAATGAVKDYVTGDPSAPAGVTSVDGKVRLFAGRRSDPRFFSATGLVAGLAQVGTVLATNPTTNAAGCPMITGVDGNAVRTKLTSGSDGYAGKNVMAIVVSLDKSLVNAPGNTALAVWASTHEGS